LTNCRISENLSTMPSDDIARALGSNIRAEMGRKRISMSKLSQTTHIPRTTLTHQINVGSVSAPALMLIAQALDVDVTDLLPDGAPAEVSA
jgi:lambda repressor-like predicted transcriptional regulator